MRYHTLYTCILRCDAHRGHLITGPESPFSRSLSFLAAAHTGQHAQGTTASHSPSILPSSFPVGHISAHHGQGATPYPSPGSTAMPAYLPFPGPGSPAAMCNGQQVTMSTSATSATTSCTLPALAAMADWTQHNYAVDDLLCLPLPIKILVRRLGLIDESEGPVVLKDTAQCDQFYFTCNTTSAMVSAKVGRVVGEVQILK